MEARQMSERMSDDRNDGKPWSKMDIADLKNHVAGGATLLDTARFLCRSGSIYDVAMKAKELGLKWKSCEPRKTISE
jgi:hypothetical protein